MVDKAQPITREGLKKIEEELHHLETVRRTEIADKIKQAKELLSTPNDAEYEDAKNDQGMLQGKILELEDILRRAVTIDEETAHRASRVIVGSGVEVEQNGQRRHFQIVGGPEADAKQGKISNDSPMGSALLGKTVGDVVDVHVPAGVVKVKIIKID